MRDESYKTLYLLVAREQHQKQLSQAMCEQRAFTKLLTDLQGNRYGVRYGIQHFPNTGGVWVPTIVIQKGEK